MSDQPHIENGFASVPAGTWLVRRGQPAVSEGFVRVRGLKGFVVPDRRAIQVAEGAGAMHLASAKNPFLTQLAVTDKMTVVSSKFLLSPLSTRDSARLIRVIPMSFRQAIVATSLTLGWVVLATASRLKRIVLEEGAIATVRADSAVAWTGKDPTGFCPKLRLRDIFLPARRGSASLSLNFYGPQIIWVEGCNEL